MKRVERELRILDLRGMGQPLSRRAFLKRAGLAGLLVGAPGILAACGDGGGSATTTPSGATATTSPGTDSLEGTQLNFFNWEGYIGEDTIPSFETEYGVKVIYDNYESNDALLAKLQAGASGYDLIVPSNYMVETMLGLDMLEPVDLDNVPNIANCYPRFVDPPFDPGNAHSVPYVWSTSGLCYNAKLVPDFEPTWEMLWRPQYKNKITMVTEIRDVFAVALFRLGYDLNTRDAAQIEEARQLLSENKPLIKHYSSLEYIDELVAEDTWLAHGWSGDAALAAAENPDIKYAVPVEGSVKWLDSLCIPKGAPHKYTAEVMMDFIHRPENAAAVTNYTYYASSNQKAEEFILPEILSDPGIYPPAAVTEKLFYLEEVGDDAQLYNNAWSELMAS